MIDRCLIDIRMGIITNKLQNNDSKTELTVFISPQLKCNLNGLSMNDVESQITQLFLFISEALCIYGC